jgi:hypothetical protein
MANSTATFTLNLSYPGPGGTTRTEPAITVLAPFMSEGSGTIDVPAGATVGSSHAIPFGTIAAATGAIVKNGLTQSVTLKSGGATVAIIKPDGFFAMAGSTAAGATAPLAALTVEPASLTQAAVGTVSYWLFGDPS